MKKNISNIVSNECNGAILIIYAASNHSIEFHIQYFIECVNGNMESSLLEQNFLQKDVYNI